MHRSLFTPACGALIVLAALAPAALATECRKGEWQGWKKSLEIRDPADASVDLYNGLLWGAGAAALNFGVDPPNDSRWSDENSFDDEVRDTLRLDSDSARTDARTASHVLLSTMVVAPLFLDAGSTWFRGSCDEAFDMATDWTESIMLTALVTEVTKVIAGRQRPSGGGTDGRESFFSGHASLAATGAGLMCSNAYRRKTWGESGYQKALPCGLGIAGALTTGVLRIAGDKHWGTDVLVGWAAGALIGYFDLPGPFDLLAFRLRGNDGTTRVEGVVLPTAAGGQLGARISMRF